MGIRETLGTRLLITGANEIKKYCDKKKLLFSQQSKKITF